MVQVTINQGTLEGTTGKDLRGNDYLKFLGVPYAKPPLGNLRFKSPEKPDKWSGVFDATREKGVCRQRDPLKEWTVCGVEDCLYLNIFTKRLPKDATDLRPVMFWIHGGGFVFGSGSEELYGGNFLLTEDIVLVTFNYRLGVLGFLSLDDPSLEVPGNAGLKDQVMALKWVQENISKFGGDPNNVTIFGESAGGASVHYHVLSPSSKGLFHKAIAQSGNTLNPWARGTKGSKVIAKALNLEGSTDREIYQTLLKKSIDELTEIQDKVNDNFLGELRPLGPVIETNSKDAFLADKPINILLSGNYNHVPFMTGYTSNEALCFVAFKVPGSPDMTEVEPSIPWNFGYTQNDPKLQEATTKLRKFYFGNDDSTKNIMKKHELVSDCQFLFGIYATLLHHVHFAKSPTYFYKMTVETELNFFKKLLKEEFWGVSHCDDLGYLFNHFLTPKIQVGSIEDIALTRFIKLWTNFAKFGNPTPLKTGLLQTTWKPVTDKNLDCLEIGKELVAKTSPEKERMQFWVNLFAESPEGQKVNSPYLK